MPASARVLASRSRPNCGKRRDHGIERTSTSRSTPPAFSRSTKRSIGWLEWPIVLIVFMAGDAKLQPRMTNVRARPSAAAIVHATRGRAECTLAQRRWVLVATILASTISYVDESVVNVALPTIGRDLAAGPANLQWVINAYTLCLAAFVLVGGAAGDRFGRRRIFIMGLVLFGAASLGCGLSRGVGPLIAARAAQGVGAALLIPCSLAIIGAAFPEAERGRATGT